MEMGELAVNKKMQKELRRETKDMMILIWIPVMSLRDTSKEQIYFLIWWKRQNCLVNSFSEMPYSSETEILGSPIY